MIARDHFHRSTAVRIGRAAGVLATSAGGGAFVDEVRV
jgi:hypothetical protein